MSLGAAATGDQTPLAAALRLWLDRAVRCREPRDTVLLRAQKAGLEKHETEPLLHRCRLLSG